jgi:thiol-disulfide isomerase/thioredoxin
MRFLLIPLAMLVLAACSKERTQPPPANEVAPSPEVGPVTGVDRSHKGQPAPDTVFNDPDGGEISLAEFRGVPTLVNLWATWCAPCVKELPTLDRLSESYAKDGSLGVIAVSQDSGPHPSVVAFLEMHKIRDLGAYQDSKMGLSGALGVEVMPTTILFDANGKEVWRYVGDLEWTSEEAARLLAEAGAVQKP